MRRAVRDFEIYRDLGETLRFGGHSSRFTDESPCAWGSGNRKQVRYAIKPPTAVVF
jgi:hypothetical protein